jgi:hypothetical protein
MQYLRYPHNGRAYSVLMVAVITASGDGATTFSTDEHGTGARHRGKNSLHRISRGLVSLAPWLHVSLSAYCYHLETRVGGLACAMGPSIPSQAGKAWWLVHEIDIFIPTVVACENEHVLFSLCTGTWPVRRCEPFLHRGSRKASPWLGSWRDSVRARSESLLCYIREPVVRRVPCEMWIRRPR